MKIFRRVREAHPTCERICDPEQAPRLAERRVALCLCFRLHRKAAISRKHVMDHCSRDWNLHDDTGFSQSAWGRAWRGDSPPIAMTADSVVSCQTSDCYACPLFPRWSLTVAGEGAILDVSFYLMPTDSGPQRSARYCGCRLRRLNLLSLRVTPRSIQLL